MTTKTLDKALSISKSAVTSTAKAIAIGIGYFLLCALNPLQAFNPFLSLIGITNLRIAEIMRPFGYYSLTGILGITMGGYAYSIYTGKIAMGAYPIQTLVVSGIWLFFGLLGKKYAGKDLLFIALAGLTQGLVVTLHLISMAVFIDGAVWSNLLTVGTQVKIATHIAIPVIGYLAFGRKIKEAVNG